MTLWCVLRYLWACWVMCEVMCENAVVGVLGFLWVGVCEHHHLLGGVCNVHPCSYHTILPTCHIHNPTSHIHLPTHNPPLQELQHMRDDQIEVALMVSVVQVRDTVTTCTRDADRKLVRINERIRKHLDGSSPQLVAMVWSRYGSCNPFF